MAIDYRYLPCGHLKPVRLGNDDDCARCADDADAYALHELEELVSDYEASVVPHVRE